MEDMVDENLASAYYKKKVFVTGHTGFKGTWLIALLHQLGAIVKGYSLAPSQQDLYNSVDGDQICESVIMDIRDSNSVKQEIVEFAPDFIFHLAAQPLVRLSYQTPLETFDINIQGTAHVLDALRFVQKPCVVVIVTTDKVYYNNEQNHHFKEDDRLGGFDPYSSSKACAELVIDSYRNSFFNTKNFENHQKSIAVARAGNVIGGGDWSQDRIMPDIIRSLHNNQPIIIRNPRSIRPWQHVLDPLKGYLRLAQLMHNEPKSFNRPYNFGPAFDNAVSVEELVKISIDEYGKGEYVIGDDIGQPHEAGILQLDITRARTELGWNPVWNEEIAIRKTIRWYLNFYHGMSCKELVLSDIEDHKI